MIFNPLLKGQNMSEEETSIGFWSKLNSNPTFRALLLFSMFRAVYGAGILIVTWLLASEAEAPLWVSIGFLLCSMVFSRVLFRFLKSRGKSEEASVSDQMLG